MRNIRIPVALASGFLLLLPLSASAGINKCVDAAGVVSYSDQPCENQGQKQAEVKNTTEFAMLAAQENKKQVVKSCMMLQEQRSQCGIYNDSRLGALFRENCDPLVQQEMRERQREQYRMYRRSQYGQYQYQDGGETEQGKQQAQVSCGKVEEEMYKLLKENFSAKLTPEDMKAIEYKLMAVPSNGYEPPLSVSRKKRR